MNWLKRNFGGLYGELSKVQREQHVRTWNHELSYFGLLEKLQEIWILLDQRSEVEVKLPLVVYAAMEIYESNRVMRKFGFRQTIPSTPQDIEDMHHIDLRGRRDGN
ncbi:hypothetical protein Golob_007570 [Gossypium lobatum]|uniref:Uncharacterized protein n=1 Tax=Gossypium lobatum TaxID=34289 RepID=A0A7J8MCV2_9ROSI|nr:hypothetical protein [Gossypium lobatum]